MAPPLFGLTWSPDKRVRHDGDPIVINLYELMEKLGNERPPRHPTRFKDVNFLTLYQKAYLAEMILDIFAEAAGQGNGGEWDMAATVHRRFLKKEDERLAVNSASMALLEGTVRTS